MAEMTITPSSLIKINGEYNPVHPSIAKKMLEAGLIEPIDEENITNEVYKLTNAPS